MGIAPSYFPHPGRAGVAGPPNRLAPRSIAKVAVLLIEIAVFQQILCSPPRSNEASDGARTEDRGSDVSMGISALRSPRSAHRRTLMPMLTSESGVARGAEPRPGPGREHGDCPKVANRTPPKPEKQADLPLRWSAVLENWRVERAGPLQISSSEHLRTGKTRFRTGTLRKLRRRHRPKANTNASSIELELVEASGVA